MLHRVLSILTSPNVCMDSGAAGKTQNHCTRAACMSAASCNTYGCECHGRSGVLLSVIANCGIVSLRRSLALQRNPPRWMLLVVACAVVTMLSVSVCHCACTKSVLLQWRGGNPIGGDVARTWPATIKSKSVGVGARDGWI